MNLKRRLAVMNQKLRTPNSLIYTQFVTRYHFGALCLLACFSLLLAQARREEQEAHADLSLAEKTQELDLAQMKEVGPRKFTEAKLQELEFQDTEEEEVEEETCSKTADEQIVNSAPLGFQESPAPVITSGTFLTPPTQPNALRGQLEMYSRVLPSPSNSTLFHVAARNREFVKWPVVHVDFNRNWSDTWCLCRRCLCLRRHANWCHRRQHSQE